MNIKKDLTILACFLLCLFSLAVAATAKTNKKDAAAPAVTTASSATEADMRFEGEKRFHSNCGRCHMAPPRFSPRMMKTIVRHMRVRATITDDDMRYILRYMTE